RPWRGTGGPLPSCPGPSSPCPPPRTSTTATLPGPLTWVSTCGDPVRGGHGPHPGGWPCSPGAVPGAACTPEGATCDPGDSCNQLLLCATSDPTHGGMCPISRRAYKENIHYLNDAEAMSAVWWKSERKASSSGAVGLQLRPLGSGCRRMTPWEAIAGSGPREKGARSPRTPSSA